VIAYAKETPDGIAVGDDADDSCMYGSRTCGREYGSGI
jgi:hypothetical protein